MNNKQLLTTLVSILMIISSAPSQDTTTIQPTGPKENDGLLLLPVIYYTPETGLAGGKGKNGGGKGNKGGKTKKGN